MYQSICLKLLLIATRQALSRHVGKKSRDKGANGERELLKWFTDTFSFSKRLKRNWEQAAMGGADCIDIPGYAIEVKRQEQLCLDAWWKQTCKQALNHGAFPILAYRQNRRPWMFCLPASLINEESWGYITVTQREFESWFRKRLQISKQRI